MFLSIGLIGCATPSPEPQPTIVTNPMASAPDVAAIAVPPTVVEIPATSPEKTMALQNWYAQEDRLYRVAAPLLINNTKLCTRHSRYLLGLTAKTLHSYPENFAAEAHASLGLDERLRVLHILPGSGASQSGIQQGDALLKVENESLPTGSVAEKAGASLISAKMRGRSRLNFIVLRNGQTMTKRIPLTLACAMSIEVGNTDQINSYGDGNRILVTRGMLEFVQSDDELAFVIAREMAHNTLNPAARTDMKAIINRLHTVDIGPSSADLGPALQPFTPVLDATVDKLALYMLARADYPITGVSSFWARLAKKTPVTIKHGHTAMHPSTSYRLALIKQISLDIKQKQKHEWPILP